MDVDPGMMERLIEKLGSDERGERYAAIRALELIAPTDEMEAEERVRIGLAIADSFLGRDLNERKLQARFLDSWHRAEPSAPLSRRLAAARMEETEKEIRASLLVACLATIPNGELIGALEAPDPESLRKGIFLLVLLEALERRLRYRRFHAPEVERLTAVLRKARSFRASHIAKPFLWHLEFVLTEAETMGRRLAKAE